jgi:hypothetical protein
MPSDRIAPSTGTIVPAGGRRPGRIASDRAGTVGQDLADLVLPWAVALVTLVARLATAAVGPTDWDSAQYAAAVARFDVTHGRPQPPGYFLYVVAGQLLHAAGTGVVHSLVLVAAVASAAAAGLTVVAGRDLGGRWVGLAAGLLVATSPFAWFSGSVVATYSFDLLIAPLLIILAWRARPHSWHGAAALAALGLVAGFRQPALQAFLLLALVAVAGSVRRVREGVVALVAGAVAVAAWFVPMVLAQPGGASAWVRATHDEALGAVRATSVLDHASDGATNLGTVAAYTTVALAPLATLALLSAVLLGIRALVRRVRRPADGPPSGDLHPHSPRDPAGATVPTVPTTAEADQSPRWTRPWYQSRAAILVAAVVPPLALVTLVQFAKSGYLLAYLPGAVIALLLVPAALVRNRPDGPRTDVRRARVANGAWLTVVTLAVVAIAALGVQRFLTGTGVLPVTPARTAHGLWLTQARYQAPYGATRSAIRSADSLDAALAQLGPFVDPRRDVVVVDSVDGGSMFFRNAGWVLPLQRVALVVPGRAVYNEQFGSLYYTGTTTIPVGPGGSVYLIAPPSLPGLARVAAQVQAAQVQRAPVIADYLVWRISPGASILGVRVVAQSGARPLGSGLAG